MHMISYASILLSLVSAIQAAVQINEFHYDNINTDVNEFIEFRHNEPLMGYEVILYNGFNGLLYNRTDLSNIPVTTSATLFNYTVVPFGRIANGMEGIALKSPNGTVVEFISYEGSFLAKNGPAKNMISIDITVSESNNCTAVGLSLQKCVDSNVWISPRAATPGRLNRNCTTLSDIPPSACGLVASPVPAPFVLPVAVPVVLPTVPAPMKAPIVVPITVPAPVPAAAPITGPIKTPVAAPVKAPITAPVAAPVKAPVTAPIKAPVAAPIKAPVAAPIKVPVAAPIKAPVAAPIKAPTSAPITAPVAAPINTPVVTPTAAPTSAPITGPIKIPVATPTTAPIPAPIKSPVAAPITVPITAPIKAPVAVPITAPVAIPIRPPTRPDPVPPTKPETKCGLFHLGYFCPFKCGYIKRVLKLC